VSNANQRLAVPYTARSMFDPPAGLPDYLEAVYRRAAALVKNAESFCSHPRRFDFSPEQFTASAQPLSECWGELAAWLREHEAELRTEAPKVLSACEGVLSAVEPLKERLNLLIGALATGIAFQPHDLLPHRVSLCSSVGMLGPHEVADMLCQIRRNPAPLAHDYLDGITVSQDSLTELRGAICACVHRRKSTKAHAPAGAGSQEKEPPADDCLNSGGVEWTTVDTLGRFAKLFGFSVDTLKRRFKDGSIRCKRLSSKSYQIAVDDLPAIHQPKYRNVQKPPAK
jgi:hypothetical protein